MFYTKNSATKCAIKAEGLDPSCYFAVTTQQVSPNFHNNCIEHGFLFECPKVALFHVLNSIQY